ncbi:MAG: type II toxin-antitoxin system HipA family toxin [Proteobacteria bacterium]|nr:type II toxin-antitoxin system HipA family toxin [Pseudomonadota bacterium]
MARKRTRIPLDVYLNARLVGRLRRLGGGAIDFHYDASWLDWDHALPVSVSLPLREDRYRGDPVIAVFDNLLPDSEPVRRRVAERVKADGHDAYNLLAKVGRDCVGALQFLPEGQEPGPAGAVKGRAVGDDYIAKKIRDLSVNPLGVDEDEEFRISIAGTQEKTAFLYWKKKWHIPHGMTATTHIMKPQIGMLPSGIDLTQSVENEHLCLKLTEALGLPSAKTEIADFEGERVLVIERFDRRWTEDKRLLRLPQEDCCQALSIPPTLKYQSDGGPGMADILDLLKGGDEPEADRRMFLKAQIVFWLLGATDGHAKNFSIFLRPGARFNLTPLYDVMSVQPAVDAGQLGKNKMKLALAVGDKRHYVIDTILPRHFTQTAENNGLPAAMVEDICAELAGTAESTTDDTLASLAADFPVALAESIAGGMRARLGTLERITA